MEDFSWRVVWSLTPSGWGDEWCSSSTSPGMVCHGWLLDNLFLNVELWCEEQWVLQMWVCEINLKETSGTYCFDIPREKMYIYTLKWNRGSRELNILWSWHCCVIFARKTKLLGKEKKVLILLDVSSCNSILADSMEKLNLWKDKSTTMHWWINWDPFESFISLFFLFLSKYGFHTFWWYLVHIHVMFVIINLRLNIFLTS